MVELRIREALDLLEHIPAHLAADRGRNARGKEADEYRGGNAEQRDAEHLEALHDDIVLLLRLHVEAELAVEKPREGGAHLRADHRLRVFRLLHGGFNLRRRQLCQHRRHRVKPVHIHILDAALRVERFAGLLAHALQEGQKRIGRLAVRFGCRGLRLGVAGHFDRLHIADRRVVLRKRRLAAAAPLHGRVRRAKIRFLLVVHKDGEQLHARGVHHFRQRLVDAALLDARVDDVAHHVRQRQVAHGLPEQQQNAEQRRQHKGLQIFDKQFHVWFTDLPFRTRRRPLSAPSCPLCFSTSAAAPAGRPSAIRRRCRRRPIRKNPSGSPCSARPPPARAV